MFLLQPIISWKANVSRTFGDIIVPSDFYLPRANFVTKREDADTAKLFVFFEAGIAPAPHTLIKMFIPSCPKPPLSHALHTFSASADNRIASSVFF